MRRQTTTAAPEFSDLLKAHLSAGNLPKDKAAELWQMPRQHLDQLLAGTHYPYGNRVAFWSTVLDLPEHEVLHAVNTTRVRMGLDPLPTSHPCM